MRLLYTFCFYLLLPLVFARLYMRGAKNPEYRQAWRERFGYFPQQLDRCIWLHSVSLGESIAAEPVINHILDTYPNIALVITNTTPSGRNHIRKKFANRVYNTYFPYDLPRMLQRFMRRINPKALILIETEIWPNLQHICQRSNIPVLLANGRLSQKSFKQYRFFGKISQNMVRAMQCITAQYEADAQHFIKLGADPKTVHVIGNIKFDKALPKNIKENAAKIQQQWAGRPVWIAASTHEGEEEIILQAHQTLLQSLPEALLIIVPRHPERFGKVITLAGQNFKVVARSTQQPVNTKTQVYVGDTMGEMLMLYATADVAFVGGSLQPIGGHNIIEPALLSLPVLTGPHMHNFTQVSKMFVAAKACKIVHNTHELATELQHLFTDATYRQTMGQASFNVVQKNVGALQRLNQHIDNLLEVVT